jgi:DNA-binding MarR family transcriptional regulator
MTPFIELMHQASMVQNTWRDSIELGLRTAGIHLSAEQALALFFISEGVRQSSSLKKRFPYLGSNLAYTLRVLHHSSLVESTRTPADRRVLILSVTPKGKEICTVVGDILSRQGSRFDSAIDMASATAILTEAVRAVRLP